MSGEQDIESLTSPVKRFLDFLGVYWRVVRDPRSYFLVFHFLLSCYLRAEARREFLIFRIHKSRRRPEAGVSIAQACSRGPRRAGLGATFVANGNLSASASSLVEELFLEISSLFHSQTVDQTVGPQGSHARHNFQESAHECPPVGGFLEVVSCGCQMSLVDLRLDASEV